MADSAGLWKLFRRRLSLALPGIAALAIMLLLQSIHFGPIERIGPLLFDAYQRAKPRPYRDAPVKIVDIDEESLRRLGQWPWPRTQIAELTQRLADAGAAAITFDIVFSEPDRTSPAQVAARARRQGADPTALAALANLPDNDAVLAQTFAHTPVVNAYFLTHDAQDGNAVLKAGWGIVGDQPDAGGTVFEGATQSLPALRDAAPGAGFITLLPDADGIVRKAPQVLTQGKQLVPSIELETFRIAMRTDSVKIKSSNGSGEIGADGSNVVGFEIGESIVPTTSLGQLYVWYTKDVPERTVPAWKVLGGNLSDAEMQRDFDGQAVFVGTSAQGLRDLVATPMQDRDLGVMVHAQALEQMINQQYLSRPYQAPYWETFALTGLGLLLALLLPWMGAARGALLGIFLVGGVMAASWVAFSRDQLLLDPTYPVLGLIAIYLIETAYTFWREERQRAYIHQAFDRYLSPEMVKRIVDDPGELELGGEEREMTVLFCDIRQFSRTSETLSPQDIIRFLIAFLTPMCDILLERKATIDKFIGDAILAFWNAPLDDPDQYGNAARGALAMIEKLRELNRTMPGGAAPWPGEIAIGIGMNSGPCCVGNMGSAQRLSYSLIGDTVNLASRIEGLTKYYGAPIAIGEDLQVHLREFATVPLDHVRVVGRDAPEVIHALLGDETLAEEEAFRAFAADHEAMGRAYRAQAWDEAEALLDKHRAYAESLGLTKLYALMRERIARYRETPPGADWDGVFGATEK